MTFTWSVCVASRSWSSRCVALVCRAMMSSLCFSKPEDTKRCCPPRNCMFHAYFHCQVSHCDAAATQPMRILQCWSRRTGALWSTDKSNNPKQGLFGKADKFNWTWQLPTAGTGVVYFTTWPQVITTVELWKSSQLLMSASLHEHSHEFMWAGRGTWW